MFPFSVLASCDSSFFLISFKSFWSNVIFRRWRGGSEDEETATETKFWTTERKRKKKLGNKKVSLFLFSSESLLRQDGRRLRRSSAPREPARARSGARGGSSLGVSSAIQRAVACDGRSRLPLRSNSMDGPFRPSLSLTHFRPFLSLKTPSPSRTRPPASRPGTLRNRSSRPT